MTSDEQESSELIRRAAAGDAAAQGELFNAHRGCLERMVRVRMHEQVRRRVNPSDVIQDTFMEASCRLKEFVENPSVPFFVWLRFLADQRLAQLHRHHLDRQMRSVNREIFIDDAGNLSWTSAGLANQLADNLTSPSMAAAKGEMRDRLMEVLDQMEAIDREILVLRHFEQLTNNECSEILGLSPTAASNRYIRALERLRTVLGDWNPN